MEIRSSKEIPPAPEILWESIGNGLRELSLNRLVKHTSSPKRWFVDTASPLAQFNVGGIQDVRNDDFISKVANDRNRTTDLTFFVGGIDPYDEASRQAFSELGRR